MARIKVEDLSRQAVGVQSVAFDFSEEHPERRSWKHTVAGKCDTCNKIVAGSIDEVGDLHFYIDSDSVCNGTVQGDEPRMNYYYSIEEDNLSDKQLSDMAKKIRDLPLCLVTFEDTGATALALTGGGMDLTEEICLAYVLLGMLPPVHFAKDLSARAGEVLTGTRKYLISACRASFKDLINQAENGARSVDHYESRLKAYTVAAKEREKDDQNA